MPCPIVNTIHSLYLSQPIYPTPLHPNLQPARCVEVLALVIPVEVQRLARPIRCTLNIVIIWLIVAKILCQLSSHDHLLNVSLCALLRWHGSDDHGPWPAHQQTVGAGAFTKPGQQLRTQVGFGHKC